MPVDWLNSVKEAMADVDQVTETIPSGSLLDITLPSVMNLILAFLPPDYVLALLDHIRLPNIISLALDFEQDEYTSVVTRLSEPATGTRKALLSGVEMLKLSGLPCSHIPTLVKAADALQNLKRLEINFNHVDYLWMDLISAPDAIADANLPPGTTFFPRLETLSVTALDGSSVRDLVQRCKDMGRPLKELYLNKEERLWDEDRVWLKENLEVFERFEGSDDEDVDDVDDLLDLEGVDEEDIIEDDYDEDWTDEDEYEDDFDYEDEGEDEGDTLQFR
ncbi:uncharacterized protein PHACADRAFT_261705 [Phanerochaete carnosa HHB-10118-sp]|uniref:Uncharacterized protein n=1 Tax=Phanerochaete carnosa (strain HHB-10118-sp) TaxID=650164 RepID=K5VY39_PHACS|nr:uncharacterized protein PHACADRAFT_261705 [Phanerochaete carnosa HHB-10118-sp]EKM51514.1 hypothetical protein PHACADRAFT_261705 [Phanerochaete carnosa HHB-10118-sp]